MRTLITGRSGSGKSTICRELQRQDYNAFDGDQIPGLCSWVDPHTDQPAIVDCTKPIEKSTAEWRWDSNVLDAFLDQHSNVFLCGSADNDLSFFDRFDRVFVLTLPSEIQRKRIVNRTEHDYGKPPEMQEIILAEQKDFVAAATQLGAVAIDATGSPAEIISSILEYTRDDS
jgi:adenylate kinase family enzyme